MEATIESRRRTTSVLAWNQYLRFCIERHSDFPTRKKLALDYPFGSMASSLYGESRRKYLWWWDSHISPKNNKWLQENLTDMDRNVKARIKLIEDSPSSTKGLKQLKEMFPSNEGSVKKALSFRDEEEGFKSEMKHLQEEISQLSLKNKNLMREMTLESQRAQALQEIVYECESGKQDALCRYKSSIERISILESGISNTRHELNEVSDQMTVQLNSVEEQFHAMVSVSRSVWLKLETQQKGLNKKTLEFEKLCVVIEKEQEKRVQAEVAQMSLEQIHIHSQYENQRLSLEVQYGTEKLKDMEASKAVLEERTNEHNVIISNLQELNLSYDAKIKDMQNEMQFLKAAKGKLEYELSLNMEENKALRKEVNGLENSLSSANVEIEGLKASSNALESFCETLVGEIYTDSVEKGVLVSHMENISNHMESLEVKNSFLENSLSDASMELENYRSSFKDMEESCMSLCDKNITLLSEKNNLVSQSALEASTCAENQISSLKHAEFNLKRELASLMERNKELSEGFHLLMDALKINAKNRTVDKGLVQSILDEIRRTLDSVTEFRDGNGNLHLKVKVENLDSCYLELLGKHFNLQRDKYATSQELHELQTSLIQQKDHHETLISTLNEEINRSVENIEVEQQKVMHYGFEIFILQRCLVETKGSNLALYGEHQNLKRQYSELEEKTMKLEKKNEDLQKFLKLEMQGHNALISSSRSQISTLENEVDLVQKERMNLEDELLAERQKTVNALPENFILQGCLVDRQETIARVHDNESPRAWRKICNKKLNSDLNKLLMIQKTLQECKIKLESLEKRKHLKSVEYSNLKEHIQDVEMSISEQIDIYGTLIHKVEENSESSNAVIWEKERRLISEQVRKGSAKIENFESELQKIEYLVLKVQEEEENKIKLYLDRKSSSTLLSFSIYSEDEVKRRKKGRFCWCIRPKTKK